MGSVDTEQTLGSGVESDGGGIKPYCLSLEDEREESASEEHEYDVEADEKVAGRTLPEEMRRFARVWWWRESDFKAILR